MNMTAAEVKVDRDAPVWSVAFQCKFLPAASFDELDMNDRSRAIGMWSGAPWIGQGTITVSNICELYADADSWLPCRGPLRALDTLPWKQHFCFMDNIVSPD